jgi:anti-anti-sigma factor
MSLQVEFHGGVAHFEGEMTIYSAAAMLREALAAISSTSNSAPAVVAFDLARITELDTAGVQILLVARNLAAQQGRSFGIVAASAMVRDVLGLCGLQDLFDRNDLKVA